MKIAFIWLVACVNLMPISLVGLGYIWSEFKSSVTQTSLLKLDPKFVASSTTLRTFKPLESVKIK